MARLYLFAEGQTEQTFADTVLKPHLARFGVYMHPPVLVAHAKRKGRVHRGGLLAYLPMRNDIVRFLKQESARDVYFTSMIDLYALPTDFPGFSEAEKLRRSPYERVAYLERKWSEELVDRRFVPNLQLHEYEAYLFSDASQFELFYPESIAQIRALETIAKSFDTPELINDSAMTAPSKRIIGQLPDYEFAKPTVGPMVGELIGLPKIREACPHFNAWLGRLESLDATSVNEYAKSTA